MKYIIIVDDNRFVVNSTASEWFVLHSILSKISDKKTWKIYLDDS